MNGFKSNCQIIKRKKYYEIQGLTSVQYCECGAGSTCPLEWDQFDGQSISQATSDQYKVRIFFLYNDKIL